MSLDPRTLEGRMRRILADQYSRERSGKDPEFILLTKYRGIVSVDTAIAAMCRAVTGALDETDPERGQLLNEVERLRATLESIAANTCCDNCREAGLVARSVLKEKSEWHARPDG